MPAIADRIFISIGVSQPGGGLEPLPGAVKAAERMAAWAEAQGYETVLVHDRKHGEVTVELLRKLITDAIRRVTDQVELKRLVVFFAGHGAALAVGDQYWILTHWQKRPTEAIKVSSLQRMLEYYGPRQVAIIGDACQEFSAKFMDMVGSPVLDMPDEARRHYELDQFFAVDAGKQAFMIKPADGSDDFCLFTEVLLDALEGDAAQPSYEQVGPDLCVTSQSLALYLDGNVAREAGKYDVLMTPRPQPGFYSDRVYARLPPAAAPTAPPPPPPAAATAPAPAPVLRPRPRPGHGGGAAAPPPVPSPTSRPGPRTVERVRLAVPPPRPTSLLQRARELLTRREQQSHAFETEVGAATVRDHFETGCGICASGTRVAEVELSAGTVERLAPDMDWFRTWLGDDSDSLRWSDALVTLANGRVVAVCLVQGFIAALHVLDESTLSLFHRPIGASEDEGREAIALLAREHAGLLDRNGILRADEGLRGDRHRIITLGCIAAQYYDSIRDEDSLRSLAGFYTTALLPLPLDIALYAGLRMHESEGRLHTGDGHPIAGRVPWMRHAWGAVATANCDPGAEPWRRQALAAMEHLASGAFTTVTADGHAALRALAGITVGQHAPQPLASP